MGYPPAPTPSGRRCPGTSWHRRYQWDHVRGLGHRPPMAARRYRSFGRRLADPVPPRVCDTCFGDDELKVMITDPLPVLPRPSLAYVSAACAPDSGGEFRSVPAVWAARCVHDAGGHMERVGQVRQLGRAPSCARGGAGRFAARPGLLGGVVVGDGRQPTRTCRLPAGHGALVVRRRLKLGRVDVRHRLHFALADSSTPPTVGRRSKASSRRTAISRRSCSLSGPSVTMRREGDPRNEHERPGVGSRAWTRLHPTSRRRAESAA